MINKKRIFQIAELNLHESEFPNDEEMALYVEQLNHFVDRLPELQQKALQALGAQDNEALRMHVSTVADILSKIRAEQMARNAVDKISTIDAMSRAALETFIESFFGRVTALSISIQMALHTKEDPAEEMPEALADEPPDDASKAEMPPRLPERVINVLAVDDMSFFLNTLKNCLQSDPRYKITCVKSGNMALKAMEKMTPDLYLLDIEMPEMNGFELAERIRGKGYKSPIVFLTGNATREHVLRAVKLGAAGFIVKPIHQDEVLDKINKITMQRRVR